MVIVKSLTLSTAVYNVSGVKWENKVNLLERARQVYREKSDKENSKFT